MKEPLVHLGMFKDSVLCLQEDTPIFDLRYFPHATSLNTYHARYGNANTIPYYICNVGTVPMSVNDTDLPPMACYKVVDDPDEL